MHMFVRTSSRDDTSSTDEHNLIPAKVPWQKLRSRKLRAFTGVSEKQISQTNISRRRMTQDGGRGGTDATLLDTNTQLKKRHLHELLQKEKNSYQGFDLTGDENTGREMPYLQ